MCRMLTFSGACSRCAGSFTWTDLSQRLSCLEAKNAGIFGHCRRGILTEEHPFDQTCDLCAAEMEADEGYGDMEEEEFQAAQAAVAAASKRKGKKAVSSGHDSKRQKRQRTS